MIHLYDQMRLEPGDDLIHLEAVQPVPRMPLPHDLDIASAPPEAVGQVPGHMLEDARLERSQHQHLFNSLHPFSGKSSGPRYTMYIPPCATHASRHAF